MYSVNFQQLNNKKFTFIEVKQKNIEITFMDYGATIMSIIVPDNKGNMETVIMGYQNLESYLENDMYLNAIIGPTSGRIQNATFSINNKKYKLDKNFLGTENLHGGKECFAFKFFSYEIIDNPNETKIIFAIEKHAENSSYPGNQIIKIIYTIKEGELLIEFIGETDEDTLLNLTNHAYFNLSGNMKNDILNHKLFVNSSKHMELNTKFIPYKIDDSINTRFDYTKFKKIKNNFYDGIYNLKTKGIDEPFILDNVSFDCLQVKYKDEVSHRVLKIYTTYPVIVVYTHNYPNNSDLLFGVINKRHLGICFEAQLPPNGININGIDNGILRKNEKYYHKTLFKFSVDPK